MADDASCHYEIGCEPDRDDRIPVTPTPLIRTLARGAAITAAAALLLAGCSAPAPESGASTEPTDAAFPVTIEHAFGETTIEEKPKNVVTWGWGSGDAAIAMGVVPVAIPAANYGADDDGVLPWIREELDATGAETPALLPDNGEEPPYEKIAATDPDVIVAVYSGVTDEQYELLSAIAPTVAYPETAWSTPWRDVVTLTAKALGTEKEGAAVLADIDETLAKEASGHPEFQGKSIAAVWDSAGTFYVYRKADPRVDFLLDLGFVSAPSVDELASGEDTFFYTLSYEQLDKLDSDVLLTYADTEASANDFVAESYAKAIPAVADGAVASVVGTGLIASVSPPTALSLPWGLDDFVTSLEAAVGE